MPTRSGTLKQAFTPEYGPVVMHVGPGGGQGSGMLIDTWKTYSFNSHFLTPTDGWSFTLGDEDMTDELRLAIAPRQVVTLSTPNGVLLSTGVIEKVEVSTSRHGGTDVHLEGFDVLGPVVQSTIDPRVQFKESMTLLDLLETVFKPYGWDREHILPTGELANENVLNQSVGTPSDAQIAALTAQVALLEAVAVTPPFLSPVADQLKNARSALENARKVAGQSKGAPIPVVYRGHHSSSVKTTTKKGKPIKDFALHQIKPKAQEGAFEFAARVAQRFGLWIFPSTNGKYLLCGVPDFEETPILKAVRKKGRDGAANNVLSSKCVKDMMGQPSVLFASGYGGGGDVPRESYTVCVVNPMVQTDNTALFDAYPNTKPIDLDYLGPSFSGNGKDTPIFNGTGLAVTDTSARPLFLNDPESKTLDELTAFLKRELALRMHKSLVYSFEVDGHEFDTGDALVPWDVDSMVAVDDDVCNVHDNLWILSRTLTKSRNGGTTTHIEAILPGTLVF